MKPSLSHKLRFLCPFIFLLSILTGQLLVIQKTYSIDIMPICSEVSANTAACQDKDQSKENNKIYGKDGVLTKVAKLVTRIVGIASVIMIMIGGFKYITSSGDPTNTKSAKDTILYAIIGILIATVAQSLIVFVLNKL